LPTIKSAKVYRGVFWILGEYTEALPEIASVFLAVRKVIGEIPILASEQRAQDMAAGTVEPEGEVNSTKKEVHKPKVLADGTYATESAYTAGGKADIPIRAAAKPPLRSE
jgi:coatomer subunit beta